ncbi:unnamed protein product [Allacma fusca]|uniref:RNA methyltransferase n=1 Tax=Allacma fusca TaxID=39272 RepID=A0A8J2JR74_9HEXA|nr:unnamed protein product [Allacma fusca]
MLVEESVGNKKTHHNMGSDSSDTEVKSLPTNASHAERKRLRKQKKEQKLLKKLKLKEEESSSQKSSKADAKIEETEKLEETSKGREYTVSIAVAGSILDNAQSPALRAYLAGQIARAAAIFSVDEIIVFDDSGGKSTTACEQMARILQFLECPQYLRKYLFAIHPDLQFAGVISPLDVPHHLRKHEILPYREGVVSNRPLRDGKGSYIFIGLEKDARVDKILPENTRVTVKLDKPELMLTVKGKLTGRLVSPSLPRREAGIYWGYSVRIATSLHGVFSQSIFREGYDVTIGTSEKGSPVSDLKIPQFKHLLVVFGGVEGLEYAFDNDEASLGEDVSELFHNYINTCPSQGSRTIRTEEAILISLAALVPAISNVSIDGSTSV